MRGLATLTLIIEDNEMEATEAVVSQAIMKVAYSLQT